MAKNNDIENKNLKLKSIGEILEYNFFIPYYQRGYRWGEKQVIELLEDISSFSETKEEDDFYCLQPIVVNPNEKYFRVIDGQQRLTTIYLILKYFNEVKIKKTKPIFNLVFETRPSNENFFILLDNVFLENNKVNEEDIDKFYMSSAYLKIDKWFTKEIEKNPSFIQDFYPVLLICVKVIWYKVKAKDIKEEIDIFTRLNMGKIPLTNSELIKALFLLNKSNSTQSDKILLASQWDNIEYKLRDEIFFSFIYAKDYKKANRIEFIFDMIADSMSISIENLKKDDDKRGYYVFDKLLNDKNSFYEEFKINEYDKNDYEEYDKRVEFLWDKVKTFFRIFEELYSNNTYYHLVGYLVNNDRNIDKIAENFQKKSKDKFLKFLKEEISKIIKLNKNKEFDYNENYKSISKILFLFNVVSTMNVKYSKYPFNLHNKQNWSLEHIHAQNTEDIKDDDSKKILLDDQKKYINNDKLEDQISTLRGKETISDEEFEDIQSKIYEIYSNDKNMDTLDNMALLDKDDNSSVSNGIFPAKRDKIQKLDSEGSFIPIGTKNVFLKYYSKNVKEAITWNKEDRLHYLSAIKKTLDSYISDEVKSQIEQRIKILEQKTGAKK